MAAPGSTSIALRSIAAADSMSPWPISATARCSTASGDSAAPLLCRPPASPPQPRTADIATDPAAIVRLAPTAIAGIDGFGARSRDDWVHLRTLLGLGYHESVRASRPNVGRVLERARAARRRGSE